MMLAAAVLCAAAAGSHAAPATQADTDAAGEQIVPATQPGGERTPGAPG